MADASKIVSSQAAREIGGDHGVRPELLRVAEVHLVGTGIVDRSDRTNSHHCSRPPASSRCRLVSPAAGRCASARSANSPTPTAVFVLVDLNAMGRLD